MKRFLLVLLLALGMLGGCASPSQFGNVEQELVTATGIMTLEEALDRWGAPNSLDEGEFLTVAFWERKKKSGFVVERMYLTFDNKTQKLKAYRYYEKAFE